MRGLRSSEKSTSARANPLAKRSSLARCSVAAVRSDSETFTFLPRITTSMGNPRVRADVTTTAKAVCG